MPTNQQSHRLSHDERKRLRALYREPNATLRSVAKIMGIAHGAVRYWVHKPINLCVDCGQPLPLGCTKTRCERCHAEDIYRKGAYWRLKALGLTFADYDRLLIEQHGVCAICHCPETAIHWRWARVKRLTVDHDHQTGKVRGLLCGNCNTAIGRLKDDPAWVAAAAAYLESHA